MPTTGRILDIMAQHAMRTHGMIIVTAELVVIEAEVAFVALEARCVEEVTLLCRCGSVTGRDPNKAVRIAFVVNAALAVEAGHAFGRDDVGAIDLFAEAREVRAVAGFVVGAGREMVGFRFQPPAIGMLGALLHLAGRLAVHEKHRRWCREETCSGKSGGAATKHILIFCFLLCCFFRGEKRKC